MSNQTMTFTSDELFTIQEMMREAKENPFHPGDYQDEETEKLIERITDALDKSYDLYGGIKMSFADAVLAMNQGKRIRMPWWGGYWYIANGTLRIHCADDKDFNAFSAENTEPLYTLSFMAANCWELVPD